MSKPIPIQLDPEDLLSISEWDADIEQGIKSSRAKFRYLRSIMRRSGLSGKLSLSENGRTLLVFIPQSNDAATPERTNSEDQASA
jgi:hypothetical protein